MFVAEGAPQRLRAQRREAFFTDWMDPVLHEARMLGIDTSDLLAYIQKGGRL